MKIKLPLSIVELLADSTEGKITLDEGCSFNLKKVLSILKEHGPLTLVEIEDEDAFIKIWFE